MKKEYRNMLFKMAYEAGSDDYLILETLDNILNILIILERNEPKDDIKYKKLNNLPNIGFLLHKQPSNSPRIPLINLKEGDKDEIEFNHILYGLKDDRKTLKLLEILDTNNYINITFGCGIFTNKFDKLYIITELGRMKLRNGGFLKEYQEEQKELKKEEDRNKEQTRREDRENKNTIIQIIIACIMFLTAIIMVISLFIEKNLYKPPPQPIIIVTDTPPSATYTNKQIKSVETDDKILIFYDKNK